MYDRASVCDLERFPLQMDVVLKARTQVHLYAGVCSCDGLHIPLGVCPVLPNTTQCPTWETQESPELAPLLHRVRIQHQQHQRLSRKAVLKVETLVCVCSLNPDFILPLPFAFVLWETACSTLEEALYSLVQMACDPVLKDR